ncbi:MAG: hypothetical protein NZ899_15295, partial [Thermoguttaceae bacterium]|nr:hypothetical protein [Thermoguttaceae bacterium]
FFLFGMGLREKYLYRDGLIIRIHDREVIHKWDKKSHEILPAEYTVRITTTDGRQVHIREDERAVWVETHGSDPASLPGTEVPVRLPRFEGHPHATTLRILHHEVLINVTRHGPVPNLFVYPKPWYRDAALMALVLKETKNVDHIRDWILSLRDPYDFNNKVAEPDNLGQALFLISLVSDRNHPLVPLVLEEAERRAVRQNGTKYLQGLTDGELHPVYQTKWLKFGLQALQLPDDWTIPRVYDSYSALFWMDFKDFYVRGADAADRVKYPYLAWACAHFHGKEPGPLASGPYPLTWEADASQAAYEGMDIVSPEFRARRLAAPHAWHAAEAFLYLLKSQNSGNTRR